MSDATFALKQVRDSIKAKLDERNAIQARATAANTEVEAIIAKANSERRDINDEETALIAERRDAAKKIEAELEAVVADLDGLNKRQALLEDHVKATDASHAAAARWAGDADTPERVGSPARVKSEARMYSPDSERRGQSFFRDLYNMRHNGDPSAADRLERHAAEARVEELAGYEARDVGTSAFGGLTVPQYLTDMVAPLQRAMAPTVAIANRHPLPPDGLTVNISRITTGTGVGAQSAEGDAATETNADDTTLAVNVRTYTGMQDVSRQALDRSTGVDAILTQDLVRAYWTTVNSDVLNGAGTNGTHLGIRSTSSIQSVIYATGTPTAAGLYPKVAELISAIQAGVFMGVTHLIMAPRRWWWLASQVSSSRPFLHVPGVSTEQAGNIGGTEYAAMSRDILGVPVVVDGSIPLTLGGSTNEDVIIGVTAPELHFWHSDGPLFIRTEQALANTLQVRYVLYGYSAFTAGRYPGAHGTITSTGLVTPTFA